MSENKSIFLVKVLKIDEKSKDDRIVRDRMWGFYPDQETAEKCVLENWTDIFENNYYNFAVVIEMPPGICVRPISTTWYKITYGKDSNNYKIKKVDYDPVNLNSSFRIMIGW